MKVLINIKSVSKTRGIDPVEYTLEDNITTAKDLISNLVDIEIDKYEKQEFKALSQEDINAMLESGKISFAFKYREIFSKEHGLLEKSIDREEAKEIAYLAFYDGLFVIFINRDKYENLDDILNLKENDEITLVRLTMLSGRYF